MRREIQTDTNPEKRGRKKGGGLVSMALGQTFRVREGESVKGL